MAVVDVAGVSKRFGLRDEPVWTLKERALHIGRRSPVRDFWALRDIDLQVEQGETIGLIGHNGSGKSTLLKCIGGILQPTTGDIRTRGRLASLLELGAGFSPDLTGRENVFLNGAILGLSKRDLEARLDDIVAFAELEQFIDNPVKTYSSGMYVRLGFAVAVNVDPDILLIDEVLAVGDESFQARCLARIRQFQSEGRTIIFVTHGVETVRQICNRAVVLSGGNIIAMGDTAECIRRFRDSLANRSSWYSQHASESPQVSASIRSLATQLVRIEHVAVIGDSGAADAEIAPGERVRIQLDVNAPELIDDISATIVIFDPNGHMLWGANTEELGPISEVEGAGRLEFDVASLPLHTGDFTVSVSLHSRDNEVVHDVVEHHLTVRSGRRSVGVIDLDVGVRYEQGIPERS